MRKQVAFSAIALIAVMSSGCGQAPTPVVPAPVPTPQKGVDDAAEILKGVNESIKSIGPLPPGVNASLTQVGSHRIKTVSDVNVSTEIHDERAIVGFGGRKLAVQFDLGQIILDDKEKVKLPDETKEVEVQFLGGKLSVKADGVAVPIPDASK
jgi:hypothetical protein